MMRLRVDRATALATGLGLALLAGCGGRAAEWDAAVDTVVVGELRTAAALVDTALNRALVLTASPDQNLTFTEVPIGKRTVSVTTSPDRERVFILSLGDEIRLRATDQPPALTVLEAARPTVSKRYELPDALTSLAIDPAGRYAIVYAGDSAEGSFIKNPNELIVVDLAAEPGDANPGRRNLPSNIGGSPKRMTFTPTLHFPGGDRRLLVVETDRDVMLLDLEHPERPEVSVPVKDPRTDSRALAPAGIAIDPGDANAPRAPVLAVRTDADDNVLIYTLGPSNRPPPDNDFTPTPNTAAVGGVPSDIAFVETNQGPRLLVMVPAPQPAGLLVKVDDSQTLTAKFTAPYQFASRETPQSSDIPARGDEVLLWSTGGKTNSVALWDLRKVPDSTFGDIDTLKSVETLNLSGPVQSVVSVAESNLKVVQTSSRALYVLNLLENRASALNTPTNVKLSFALDGERAWVFEPSAAKLARVALRGPHVATVIIDRPVDNVLEIERTDGGRALLVLHRAYPSGEGVRSSSFGGGTVGVTVYDALSPDVANSRRYSAVMLEGLIP